MKVLGIWTTPETKSDWRIGRICGKGRVEANNCSALHLPLGKWKMMTIDTLGFECHPVLLTAWHGARLDPVLAKVFDLPQCPWQKQLSLNQAQGVDDHLIPKVERWNSLWQADMCQKNFSDDLVLLLLFVLAMADGQTFHVAVMQQLKKDPGMWGYSLKRLPVSIRRFLLNEQITHEWHCAVSQLSWQSWLRCQDK